MNDPRNLTVFANFPSLSGLEIPGLDSVEQQQGEFELLMQSGPGAESAVCADSGAYRGRCSIARIADA